MIVYGPPASSGTDIEGASWSKVLWDATSVSRHLQGRRGSGILEGAHTSPGVVCHLWCGSGKWEDCLA